MLIFESPPYYTDQRVGRLKDRSWNRHVCTRMVFRRKGSVALYW